jgi:hypothetical protein
MDLLIIDSGVFPYRNLAMFAGTIAQDVNPTEADILAAVQKPFSTSMLGEKSGPPAWKQLPTWYQVSENDRASPPNPNELQLRFLQKRIIRARHRSCELWKGLCDAKIIDYISFPTTCTTWHRSSRSKRRTLLLHANKK